MPSLEWVTVESAECVGESPKAIWIQVEDGDGKMKRFWVPRSQLSTLSEVAEEGDRGDLIIARWLAEKRELDFVGG